MHLFLIRHGETEHNVAGLLAGVTDSSLTNHGVLQTQRLGKFLAATAGWHFTHIFASDLQRAHMTADAIRGAQLAHWRADHIVPQVVQLKILREQNFGSLELAPWNSSRKESPSNRATAADADFKPKETVEAMTKRAAEFLNDFLVPILATETPDSKEVIAVVSHGLFLGALWRTLLSRFLKQDVSALPEVSVDLGTRPFEHLGSWTNTGYLHLCIENKLVKSSDEAQSRPNTVVVDGDEISLFHHKKLLIRMINGKAHLQSLKRTRGGVGSATYDSRQKGIEGFFKKTKISKPRNRVGSKPC